MLFSTNSAIAFSGLLCDSAMIRIAFQSSPIRSLPFASAARAMSQSDSVLGSSYTRRWYREITAPVQPNTVHHDQFLFPKSRPAFPKPHYRFGGMNLASAVSGSAAAAAVAYLRSLVSVAVSETSREAIYPRQYFWILVLRQLGGSAGPSLSTPKCSARWCGCSYDGGAPGSSEDPYPPWPRMPVTAPRPLRSRNA